MAGLAVGVKLSAAYLPAVLALMLLVGGHGARERPGRRVALDGLATLGGFVLPFVLALPFVDVHAAYEPVLRLHWVASRRLWNPIVALQNIGAFYRDHILWAGLAVLGVRVLARHRAWRPLILLLGREILVVAMLAQHAPLWPHVRLPLLPPLAVAGAMAGAEGVAALGERRRAGFAVALALGLVAVYLAGTEYTARITQRRAGEEGTEVVRWLQTFVPPASSS